MFSAQLGALNFIQMSSRHQLVVLDVLNRVTQAFPIKCFRLCGGFDIVQNNHIQIFAIISTIANLQELSLTHSSR